MTDTLQPAFRALADPTRRAILHMLGQGEMTIAQVSDQFDMTRAAVKKHLTVLQEGDLIAVRTKGRERINTLHVAGMKPLTDWLNFFDQFWDEKLADLKTAIENKDISND